MLGNLKGVRFCAMYKLINLLTMFSCMLVDDMRFLSQRQTVYCQSIAVAKLSDL